MLHISVSRVYSVATFYENFSLEPKGKHIIKVCDGTACHVRKSGPIYDAIHEYLKLDGKQKTSPPTAYSRWRRWPVCGACGLAPVMTVDGEVYAKMTPETALAELERHSRKGGGAMSKLTREGFRAMHETGGGGAANAADHRERADLRRYRLHRRRLHEGV